MLKSIGKISRTTLDFYDFYADTSNVTIKEFPETTAKVIGTTLERCSTGRGTAPPEQYNPNLVPIGHGFGFIVLMEGIEDW
jgi:hypothetical protein